MIIYLVEPGLDSKLLSLLASFNDFFLVVQFLNSLQLLQEKNLGFI